MGGTDEDPQEPCRSGDHPIEWWWPPDYWTTEERDAGYARAIPLCHVCPIVWECAEWGIWEPEGLWGGTTPEHRKSYRREVKPDRPAVPCRECGKAIQNPRPATLYHPECRDRRKSRISRERRERTVHECPQCGASRAPQARGCPQCGWSATRSKQERDP